MSNFNQNSGYNGGDKASLSQTFAVQAGTQSNLMNLAAKPFEAVLFSNNQTVTSMLTGTDFTAGLPQATAKAGQNVGANVQASVDTKVSLDKVDNQMGAFKAAVEDMQKPLREALNQAADVTGNDRGSVGKSFDAGPQSGMADAALTVAGAKVGMPVVKAVSTMTNVMSAIDDVKAIAGKLPAAKEAEIADTVRSLLSPKTDPMTGDVTEPAAVPSNIDTDALAKMDSAELVKTLKQAMLPAENQPEWAEFQGLKEELSQDSAVHASMEDTNEKALGDAEKFGLSKSDVTVEQAEIIASDTIDRFGFVGGSLADKDGYNSVPVAAVSDISDVSNLLAKNGTPPASDMEAGMRRMAAQDGQSFDNAMSA